MGWPKADPEFAETFMPAVTIKARAVKIAMAASLAIALGGCLGYDGYVQRGYVVDPKALEQVRTGSSAEQVLVVLGTPSTTSTIGGDAWYYISQDTNQQLGFMKREVTGQRVLAIYFTKAKKVERVANYGLEDGRVIDFVTRTTPTAGGDASFIQNMVKGLLRF